MAATPHPPTADVQAWQATAQQMGESGREQCTPAPATPQPLPAGGYVHQTAARRVEAAWGQHSVVEPSPIDDFSDEKMDEAKICERADYLLPPDREFCRRRGRKSERGVQSCH